MWNDYLKEQDEIKASDALKATTLEKMSTYRKKRKLFLFQIGPVFALASSFLILVFIGQGWLFDANNSRETNLVFERAESGGRHFSAIGQAITLEEFELSLGVYVSEFFFADFPLYEERSAWFLSEDHSELRAIYVFAHADRNVELIVNNTIATVEVNSTIAGQEVALFYQEAILTGVTYIAIFIERGIYFQVRMTGVTEEEFVEYVSEFIDFLH